MDMNSLAVLILILQIILIGFFWYIKQYITTKGQNQATKEDIAEITELVKRVETQFQIELGRHSLRNELVSKAAELFYDIELISEDLIAQHGLPKVQARDLPYDEKRKLLVLFAQVNALFAKLYLTMPDETYKNVIEAVPDRVDALRNLRLVALVSLRQAQFPDSKYLDAKSIRTYSYDKTRSPKAEA